MSGRPLGRWLFGKLPVLGDFVARGLDMAQRERLDAWLSEEMEIARERFPDDFEHRYDSAPAWNFVDCDDTGRWSGGVLCASMDRAGRRFPLMCAAPARDAGQAVAISGAWMEILQHAFASGWGADRIQRAELVETGLAWEPELPQWTLIGEDGPAKLLDGRFPRGVVWTMAEMAL
ncbi:MAG: type VI secretion system-associated protein TagF [Caenibius sp.]